MQENEALRFNNRVKKIIKELDSRYPNPRCELYYETPFQLLVSVVLSAQTTDKMVNRCMEPVYKKMHEKFSPHYVVKKGRDFIYEIIKSIGLAPTKSRNIVLLSEKLIETHAGEVPGDRESLEELAGVGRKTANVILGELFGHPTIAVDTHVYRLGMRLGFHDEKTPLKAEKKLLEVIPKKHLPMAHHWLVLHGRYVCKSQKPQCDNCCLQKLCPSRSSSS